MSYQMGREPERTAIRNLYIEWRNGYAPDVTFAEYLAAETEFEYDEITWGLVGQEIRMTQEFIETVPYEEAIKLSETEFEAYEVPEHTPAHPQNRRP